MKDVVEYGLFFVSVTLQDIGKFGVITTVLPNVQIAMCNVQGLNFLLLMVKLFIMIFLLLKVTVLLPNTCNSLSKDSAQNFQRLNFLY